MGFGDDYDDGYGDNSRSYLQPEATELVAGVDLIRQPGRSTLRLCRTALIQLKVPRLTVGEIPGFVKTMFPGWMPTRFYTVRDTE